MTRVANVPSGVSLEGLNKTLNLLYGFLKDWDYWNAMRHTSERSKLYSEAKITVHIHTRVRPAYFRNAESQEFCARFNRLTRNQLRNEFHAAIDRGDVNSPHPRVDRRDRDGYVFIRNVDIVDYPKRGAKRVFPSEVRLRPSDACLLHSFSEVLQMAGNSSLESTATSFYREIETGTIGEGGISMLRNLPQELVKRGTDLVRYFSNENAPFLWGVGQGSTCDEYEFAKVSCPISTTLAHIFTRVVLSERVSPFLEGFQVLDCPLNLEVRAIERMHERLPFAGGR